MRVPFARLPGPAKLPACVVPLCGYSEPDEPVTQDGYTAVERNRGGEERPILEITGSGLDDT
jgi:hypothetical protein